MRSKVLAFLVLLVPSLLASQGVTAEICLRGSLLEQVGDFLGVGPAGCGSAEAPSCCTAGRSCCSGGDSAPEGPSVERLEACGCCSALSLDPVELAFDGVETAPAVGVQCLRGVDDVRTTDAVAQADRPARPARAPPPGRILAPGLLPGVRPLRI